MHSVHAMAPNHPQCVSLFQCTQFTQSPQSPTVSFLISMHSIHTRSPNHPICISLFQCTQFTQGPPITQSAYPQCVFLFQCTQFTQGPTITHSVFSYFHALSSHKVPQSPTVCFLISMHSVHTKSLNYPKCISLFQCTQYTQGPPITQSVHPQCVFLFPCTQFTQSLPITHSVFPYFNALSSHNVPQLLTVSFFISMHSAQRVWLLFDRGVDAWSIEGLIVSWIRSWWLVDS